MTLGNVQVILKAKDKATWPLLLASRRTLRLTLKIKGYLT
jgi:hypothetical protein